MRKKSISSWARRNTRCDTACCVILQTFASVRSHNRMGNSIFEISIN